jgi:hypothetical protein
VLGDLVPGLSKLRSLVTLALAVVTATAMDWSLFEGFGVELREDWLGVALTGAVLAGVTSVWRALFGWLGSTEDDAEEASPRRKPPVTRAA